MTDNRDQMFARIRRSLESAVLPDRKDSLPPPARTSGIDQDKVFEEFTREAKAIGAQLFPANSSGQAMEIVIDLLRKAAEGTSRGILAWDDSQLPVPGLDSAIRAAGFERLDPSVPDDPKARLARLSELGGACAGLTGAQGGLADSGTLALLSGPARPRLASLLPPIHIALLSRKLIYPSMADFMAAHSEHVSRAGNLVFITGPSRTADIELTLTLGVHGPRELYIIIVDWTS
jgi:L-lactate dehydrogenase complex protein LldG